MRALAVLVALAPAAVAGASSASPKAVRFLWSLSTETGPVKMSSYGVSLDLASQEVLVTGENIVRIFSPSGMEDFAFMLPEGEGRLLGAAALGEANDILLLTLNGERCVLRRASFRGEIIDTIEPRGAPADFLAAFGPSLLRVRGGRIYLADLPGKRVLVLEADGTVVSAHDVGQLLDLDGKEGGEPADLTGFGVDVDGGLLFTVATRFRAYVVSPSGEVRVWGTAGGAPGRFNVIAGIAADENHYYVADALKSVVNVFDRQLRFVEDFGHRRAQSAGGLVSPGQIEAGAGRVYVSQRRDRGISVFAVSPRPIQSAVADGRGKATSFVESSNQ